MDRLLALWARVPKPLVDVLAVAVAIADAIITVNEFTPEAIAVVVLACGGLALRRRLPLVAFALTLPASATENILVAPMIALFTLAVLSRRRWLIALCAAAFAAASALPWPLVVGAEDQLGTAVYFVYQLATAAAPAFLGQLVQAHGDLSARIHEIEEARQHERELYAERVLARERAQLAREMHDVVSHQVSLIAVQAAALQVAADSPATAEAAGAIRGLSVTTLDELRTMVAVLRASGSPGPGLAPQPTMSDVRRLVDSSGMDVVLHGELPATVAAPVQRALYRTVQEALTNARKHAPGAAVRIDVAATSTTASVVVENSAPTGPALPLPGSGIGLIGLRERAALLGGAFEAGPTPGGGFRVAVTIPVLPT